MTTENELKPISQYLNTRNAAQYIGVSEAFLEQARMRGVGPAYVKLGDKKKSAVRYRISDLDAFAEKSRVEPSVQ